MIQFINDIIKNHKNIKYSQRIVQTIAKTSKTMVAPKDAFSSTQQFKLSQG